MVSKNPPVASSENESAISSSDCSAVSRPSGIEGPVDIGISLLLIRHWSRNRPAIELVLTHSTGSKKFMVRLDLASSERLVIKGRGGPQFTVWSFGMVV